MKTGMKSGQILILVLLIIVVVLAVGLSMASRNITNLRTATQSEQSQRAFGAAEGGVEKVLSNITGIGDAIAAGSGTVGDCTVVAGQANCNVALEDISARVTVVGSPKFEDTIPLGNVGQIRLFDNNGNSIPVGTPIKIEWARPGTSEVDDSGSALSSLEITQIFGPSYNQVRYFVKSDIDRGANENIKSEAGDKTASPCAPSLEYKKCVLVSAESSARIIRIKPFWADTTIRVSAPGMPVQTYDVTSTASTDIGVTRRVQVIKTALPQMPAVFDYVLYSEGDIRK